MPITGHVEAIKQKAKFLEKKGFKLKEVNEYTMKYSHKHICSIEIYYGRYSDRASVDVCYENKSLPRAERYSVEWIRTMKKYEEGVKDIFGKAEEKAEEKVDKMADLFYLLDYLYINFDYLTNIEYCRKMENKINENFEKGIW